MFKTEDLSPLTRRRIVIGFVAIQIAIPGLALLGRWVDEGSRPVREWPLSFQMYSGTDAGDYVGETDQGTMRVLDTSGLPPVIREIGYGTALMDRLCDANPDIVRIHIEGGNEYLRGGEQSC